MKKIFRSGVILRFSKLKIWFNGELKLETFDNVFIELTQLCSNPAIYFTSFVDG